MEMTRAKLLFAAICLLSGLTTTALAQQTCSGDGECDDGLFCNGMETCVVDTCQPGVAPDCSPLDSTCTNGVCNEAADACQAQPANQGGSCDDGLFCTVGDACDAGECTGSTRDCSAEDGECTNGVCDEDTNACEAAPANNGDSCNDGQFCTVNE